VNSPAAVVADTHIFLWYLQDSARLRESTRTLLDGVTAAGAPILISAVTVVELRYLAEKGTLTEADLDAVHAVLDAPGTSFEVAPVDAATAWAVGSIPRDAVADPWDRMIAATAIARDVALVTYDRKLTALPGLQTNQ
jgi:PIN domain nuclease of toxin-antitoxin system